MNRYISKSYTTTKNAIDRAGAAVVSTITSYKKSTKATLDDQKSVRQKNQSVIQMRVKTSLCTGAGGPRNARKRAFADRNLFTANVMQKSANCI